MLLRKSYVSFFCTVSFIIAVLSLSLSKGAGGEAAALPQNVTHNAYVLSSPITAVCKGTVTSEFGSRIHPITKKAGFHTGIDIANKKGTPICAAFSGSIQDCGKNEAYGNYVLMRHSDNLYTFTDIVIA